MNSQFSKVTLIFLVLSGFLFSCSKEDEPKASEPITILSSDYKAAFGAGALTTYSKFEATSFKETPTEGANQTWDLSAFPMNTSTSTQKNNVVPTGTSFTTATFFTTQPSNFLGAFMFNQFFEISEEGYYRVGTKINPVIANVPPATLEAEGEETPITPKELIFKFPMVYKNINSSESVVIEKFLLTAAPFGLTNAPVERKITSNRKTEVIGWGKIMLPKGAITTSADALLVKNTIKVVENYFLNGTTAPAALLGLLSLKEGGMLTTVNYIFMTKEFGGVANILFEIDESGNIIKPAIGTSVTLKKE